MQDIFDRNKDNPFFSDYWDRVKGKYFSSASKHVDEIRKIHLPLTENTGLDLLNLCHESIHYLFGLSPISIQLRDLMHTSDFIQSFVQDINQLPKDAKYDQITFAIDLLSGNKEFRCKRYYDLCLVYAIHFMLYERKNIFLEGYRECSEGVATYCSLHMQEGYKGSFLDILYSFIPNEKKNVVYDEQKKVISKINSLPNNNYYKIGYEKAKDISNKHGIDAVLMSAMLSHCVPFYNFDPLHDQEPFLDRCKYLYNVNSRWDYFISLSEHKQKTIFRGIKSGKNLNSIFEFIDKQKRPKRKKEFWNPNIYYLYDLLLHQKIVHTVCRIYGEDVTKDIEDYIKNQLMLSFIETMPNHTDENIDMFFSQLCNPTTQGLILQNDSNYIDFVDSAIYNICKSGSKPEFISQVTEDDAKKMIMRNSNVEIYYQIRNKLNL